MSEETLCSNDPLDVPPRLILNSIVEGDGVDRYTLKPGRNRTRGSKRCAVFELSDAHEPRLAFHQRVDSRLVVFGLYRVAFPVSNAASFLHNCRTVVNRRALWLQDSMAPAHPFLEAPFSAVPQVDPQIFAAGPRSAPSVPVHLRVYILIDCFVRNLFLEVNAYASRNLLRRPAQLEVCDEVRTNLFVLEPLVPAAALSLCQRSFLRNTGRVHSPLWKVPPQLPGDRCRRPPELTRNGSNRPLFPEPPLYILPL